MSTLYVLVIYYAEFNINVNGKLFCIEIAKTDFEDLKIFNNYINNIEELKDIEFINPFLPLNKKCLSKRFMEIEEFKKYNFTKAELNSAIKKAEEEYQNFREYIKKV